MFYSFIFAYRLLRVMRKERRIVGSLTELGLNRQEAIDVLTHPIIGGGDNGETGVSLDGMFDASDRPEGGDIIVWWNDFEKDRRLVLPCFSGCIRFLIRFA